MMKYVDYFTDLHNYQHSFDLCLFQARTRSLVRGEALCDDCSPPPEDNAGIDDNKDHLICGENTNFVSLHSFKVPLLCFGSGT